MSHLHERKEKTCLNCGASLIDRYCHVCGQENLEPKESFGHLLAHFIEDFTHFDGKLFSTLKYLLFKPGFLTAEYIKGKRASYLNPIRMFLFISTVFFLLIMTFWLPKGIQVKEVDGKKAATKMKQASHSFRAALDSMDAAIKDTAYEVHTQLTLHQYDSLQNTLAPDKKDDKLTRYFARKMYAARDMSHDHAEEFLHRLFENFFHSLPYMLFISVPLIAIWLMLLYIRRRKDYFYVSHVIFTVHYYCLVYLMLMVIFALIKIGGIPTYFIVLLILGIYLYLYAAMLRFYKQGWLKTFVKYLILQFLVSFTLTVLFLLLGFNSLLHTAA